MNIYLKNGFADMGKIMSLPYPLIFVIGGRGTGKTYGAVEVLLNLPPEEKFFFLRRTQDEADTISYTDFSPFQPVINDNPEKYAPVVVQKIPHVKNISGVWHGELNDEAQLVPTGDAIGYIGALSTIHKIRGFNMQSVTMGVFDEFIPEKHVANFRGGAESEGNALLNAIETIARNREIMGKKPFKMVCLSNANTIASPVFQSLGIIDTVNKMAMKGKQECILPDRGIAVFIFRDSPISKAKANTSLYKAAKDGDFSQAEKITHTGALLVGTYDNFTDGDPSEFLRILNDHMPTAAQNSLIFIERTGHTYQGKNQEVADDILHRLQEWR